VETLPLDSATDADHALLARIARELVGRRLTTPAIVFLESVKPLNFVGSQFLLFLDPLLKVFLGKETGSAGQEPGLPSAGWSSDYRRFVALLEKRETIERLIVQIEEAEEAVSR
jgi:hypothetical protein